MTADFKMLREAMVREQLMPRGIKAPGVLRVMRKVPREKYARVKDARRAYGDFAMPTALGQTISQPYMVALMTRELKLTGVEKVLEIGTGSGYQTAILAELGASVYTIEKFTELSEEAQLILGEQGYDNIHFQVGDGTLGWPAEAPFDRIMVTAAAPRIPAPLEEQLAEGGIMVVPVGGAVSQELLVARKVEGRLESRSVCGCVFVKLIGQAGWTEDNGS